MSAIRSMSMALIALVCFTAPAAAQITTGSVTGSVRDSQAAVVPGATIALISETRGTRLTDVVTSPSGDFVFVNVPPDRYTIEVAMDGFKPLRQTGVVVSAGDRVALPTLTIDVGGLSETVQVASEAPVIQASSGERSFAVTTEAVENLPIANRSFTALASLAPGVIGTTRVGDRSSTGGSNTNFMMDGVSTMDTGSNSPLLQMNVESIAEVKVLVSNYQAEYGRSSGIQVTAVTKGGTNQFRGSTYGVFRDSDWYANSKVNILNGDPKTVVNEKDLGYSIGGPIGRPGGRNKLFFFYAHEYAPRTSGNNVVRFRMPTALERRGDFSQTTDNNGALYNLIRDASTGLPCTTANTSGCFQDGGVLGRIPAGRLYETGLNILKMYPMPNTDLAGANYNYEITRPVESLRANQPAVRLDYQPAQKLRATFKYSGWSQQNRINNGSIPGFNDTQQFKPIVQTVAMTVNYTLTPTTFLEATYGHAQNELTGCALAQGGTGPTFCQAAFSMNDVGNRFNTGLGDLPFLFPDANIIDPDYYAFEALNTIQPPNFVDGRVVQPPNFNWGNRITNTPPNVPFPGYLNKNATDDVSISLTKVWGRHTIKGGFYNTYSFKAQQRQGWAGTLNFGNDTNNPIDSTFGFANAALGNFTSYQQFSRYVEGTFKYTNTEGFVQDNWRVSSKLTLDYGIRLVHQQPQYDSVGQASNFLPDRWAAAQAPLLYGAGCAGASPCSGVNRQARNPLTGQLLGPNTAVAIGTLVPNSGDTMNGLFLSGQGIVDTTYTWPTLAVAPRFGMAYDVTGAQKIVLRGGGGLFFDRPSGNSIYSQVQNPPTIRDLTVRYAPLSALAGGLTTEGAPTLAVFEYDAKLPSSTQWNAGVQIALPWATVVDAEYVGQHGFNIVEGVNINAVDFGSAFEAGNQDPTLSSTTPGGAAVVTDRMRAFRGFGAITQQLGRGWITHHSLQLSLNRRFRNGVSFGLNDTITLSSEGSTAARLQHNADGSYSYRDDQAAADRLLGRAITNRHVLKGNFVWDLPDLGGDSSGRRVAGLIVNDWQLSGIWTATTGAPYAIGYTYQNGGGNVNLTGSPDYGARIRLVGDTGSGCNGDVHRQFNTAAFQGPLSGSDGLESGNDYLRGCFQNAVDLAVARNIKLGGNRQLQFRLDLFNALNQAIVTARNTNINLSSPSDPVTATNLPFDAAGNLVESRSLPRNAGFGVATVFQDPRRVQMQLRFSF